jgi:O-antigen ligase
MATAALALLWLHRRRAAVLALAGAGVFVAATIGTQLLLLPGSHLFDEGQEDLYTAAYEAPESVDGRPGETVTVPVVVTNTGQLTWEEALGSNYFLGADWIDVDNLTSIEWADVSATLPDRVAVGESVAVEAHLTLPDAPGVHIAGWNMTNPTGVRFSTYGTPGLTTLVLVGGAEPPTDPGADRVVLLAADIQEPPNRSELWGAAIRMISEKPLQGVGPGTFRLRYGPYIDRPNAEVSIHSNSFILEIASTTGLLGLAAFATLVGFVVVRVIGALRRTILLAFILGALSAFFWAGLVDYFLGFMGNAGLFWSLLGLGLGLATRPSAPSSDVPL